MKSILFIPIFVIFVGCHKTENAIEYKGEVIREVTDCTTPKGFAYIIKYITLNNSFDSLITSSLPSEFNLAGTKILFKISNEISADEIMTCNTNIITPIQKSIYDVKSQ